MRDIDVLNLEKDQVIYVPDNSDPTTIRKALYRGHLPGDEPGEIDHWLCVYLDENDAVVQVHHTNREGGTDARDHVRSFESDACALDKQELIEQLLATARHTIRVSQEKIARAEQFISIYEGVV